MGIAPPERIRLLLFVAAEMARARRARGLLLNVPEATALIADTVCEAARDGLRLAEAVEAGRARLAGGGGAPGGPDAGTEGQGGGGVGGGARRGGGARPVPGRGGAGRP